MRALMLLATGACLLAYLTHAGLPVGHLLGQLIHSGNQWVADTRAQLSQSGISLPNGHGAGQAYNHVSSSASNGLVSTVKAWLGLDG